MEHFFSDQLAIARIILIVALSFTCCCAVFILKKLRLRLLPMLIALVGLGAWTVAAVIVLITQPMMIIGKLAFLNAVVVFLATSLTLNVLFILGIPERDLEALEEGLDRMRDHTLFQAADIQARLAALKDRLTKEDISQEDATRSMVMAISPVAMLVLKRETNALKWGMAVFNLGRTLTKHLRWKK